MIWLTIALAIYAVVVTVYAAMYFITLRRATKQLEEMLDLIESGRVTPDVVRIFRKWRPVGDIETVKREMARPDGMIEVRPV